MRNIGNASKKIFFLLLCFIFLFSLFKAAAVCAASDESALSVSENEAKIPEFFSAAAEKIKNAVITFKNDFYNCFIKDSRYRHITNGLAETLKITFAALVIGLGIGFFTAVICAANDKNGTLRGASKLCRLYLTVFRGTPVIVQLLIIYYLWLGRLHVEESYVAILAFGLNSGAYVAEIVRSGIISIDNGQLEAGRSLGFSFSEAMLFIILPQAFKNVLPALANEFISLLKETSIASFIAVKDMMKGADAIAGITFNMYMPYIAVALIYLFIVVILTKLVSLLERRLRSSEA